MWMSVLKVLQDAARSVLTQLEALIAHAWTAMSWQGMEKHAMVCMWLPRSTQSTCVCACTSDKPCT